ELPAAPAAELPAAPPDPSPAVPPPSPAAPAPACPPLGPASPPGNGPPCSLPDPPPFALATAGAALRSSKSSTSEQDTSRAGSSNRRGLRASALRPPASLIRMSVPHLPRARRPRAQFVSHPASTTLGVMAPA